MVSALGLDGPDAEPIVGGRVSKVWRASRGGAPVALRQSPPFRQLPEVTYECDLLTTLAARTAPVADVVAGPTPVDGSVWVAFGWVDGVHPAVPVEDLASYGRLLATLHDHTAASVATFGQRPGWGRLDEFLTMPRPGGGTMAEILPDFERASGAAGAWLRRLAEDVHGRLAKAPIGSFPRVVAHGDFAPGQVLMHDDGVAAVLDWDFAHVDLRLADLAIAASMARPTVARAATFVRGYFDVAGTDVGDLDLLADLRCAFHLTNLGNYLCARWAHGADIAPQVKMLTERLEREQWWGPTLVAAAREAEAAGTRSTPASRPVTRESSDLELAQELADRAAVVAQHYFERGVSTEIKADASPVTEADRAVEHLLRDALAELRPDDGVLGEEFGGQGESDRTWILDPIDGTGAFARGLSNWRIQLALESEGEIVVAVVDAPALGVRWWAATGTGTHERATGGADRRLHVSKTAAIDDALVAPYPRQLAHRLPASTRQPHTPFGLIDLIRGLIDAYFVECCHTWDHAPWILLVREAGGTFTDHRGGSAPDQRGGLYSNGRIHQDLLAALSPALGTAD
ncbi:inositol monophosphatase family protein [Tenggerimyces flavus]|uniref:Inositol monophosphatase family protein n=1 Tax=Tenggerimyces flavus TaxID=1708749 RepID=A0ABV7YE31_9ACTN|nr:inositol monophosphatase family protein [Tenggerimyces flavus]MBM7786125.1 fructose-1,6-bisphosphatase/inositol monophosphatase family enzyme/aminoglycoside phosphotransferase (APT) family kinase protein [Tenggerimyces flavus]